MNDWTGGKSVVPHETDNREEQVASIAKALAHPARIQIVQLLAMQSSCRGAEVFGELPLAQSTVSEHLRVLKDAGVISASPNGNGMLYCLDANALEVLRGFLADLGVVVSGRQCCDSALGGSDGGR